MLGQFNSNWLPTLAWALTGFLQRSQVKGREGRDGHYTGLRGSYAYSTCKLHNYDIKDFFTGIVDYINLHYSKTWVALGYFY